MISIDWDTGTRGSFSPIRNNVGVRAAVTYFRGECSQ